MSIWPASLSMKGASKLVSWVLPAFSGTLVNATVLTLLLKSFAEKSFSRGVLANTARSVRFFLEALPFLAADRITDFGIALAKLSNLVPVLSFYKSTDRKPFLTDHAMACGENGLASFICLWSNARIVAVGRKVRFCHMLPFMRKQRSQFGCGYLQTAQEVTGSLVPNSNHSRTSLSTQIASFSWHLCSRRDARPFQNIYSESQQFFKRVFYFFKNVITGSPLEPRARGSCPPPRNPALVTY